MEFGRGTLLRLLCGLFLLSGWNGYLVPVWSAEPQRSAWTTSRITGSASPPKPYRVERVFPFLQFVNPVTLTRAPGHDRLFVAELAGRVLSFEQDQDCREGDLFVDLARAPQSADRLYGLTFHPDFPSEPSCFVCYTTGPDLPHGTRVSRFRVELGQVPTLDTASEEILLTWRSGGHNGGCLKFGPDGHLYISTGDGGPAFPPDPLHSGQDVSNLLASILRIDVDRKQTDLPYAVPEDNPFVDTPRARGEVWAFGLRNPWRMSFDAQTGDLWVGDVGWEMWEMIYRVARGANYGWSVVEGAQPVHRERALGPSPIVEPTIQHSHIESRSITGGFVYRGQRLRDLFGWYIYGDYVTGKVWALRHDGQQVAEKVELADTALQIICFGVNNDNELYLVGYDGTIHRLAKNDAVAAYEPFPTRLSETGLFSDVAAHEVAEGLVPYEVIAEPWMDGATAERFLGLPGNSVLGIEDIQNPQLGRVAGQWRFPTDAVLMKTVSMPVLAGDRTVVRRLETQILHFDQDTWRAYNFIWNDDQSDATLSGDEASEQVFVVADTRVPGGIRQQTWHHSSRTECLLCHSTRGGTIYGFRPEQLDRSLEYGDRELNQLQHLRHLGVFQQIAERPAAALVDPTDPHQSLEDRARSYLHVNCAHCHQRGGGGTAAVELPYHLSLPATNLLAARPTQGTFNIHSAQVVAAGAPFRSVLYYRMAKLGRGRMPYLGSSVIDDAGLELVHDWIASLPSDSAGSDVENRNATELAELRQTSAESARRTIGRLLASTEGALALLRDLDRLPKEEVALVLEAGTRHADPLVRDLFERYLPESERQRRLGANVDASAILALTGDEVRGRELFLTSDTSQCRNCHRHSGTGRELGPDLTEIARRQTKRQILDSILRPSKNIAPEFTSHLLETADGRVHVGLLVERSAEAVVLRDVEGKEIRVADEDVELLTPQQQSLMPELLVRDFTAQQLADLLAFLAARSAVRGD